MTVKANMIHPSPKTARPLKIAMVVRLYPPVNSSGAKRAEALSKYFARMGHHVSVITPAKTLADGELTEAIPEGVTLIELDRRGRDSESRAIGAPHEPLYSESRSLKRRFKDIVMKLFGQLPDPRVPFVLSLLSRNLSASADKAFREADVVIGSCPPWTMLLGAMIVKKRYGVPAIFDYRDHFADNWEMPGSRFAKWLERKVDRWLISRADQAVAISAPMRDYYAAMSDTPCALIMNGFDHEKVERAKLTTRVVEDDLVRIRHTGIVTPPRVPDAFFKALSILKKNSPEKACKIQIEFYGYSDVFRVFIKNQYPDLEEIVNFNATVPHHEALELMHSADYLLFCGTITQDNASARGVLTTKIFEYLGTGRPILAHTKLTTIAAKLIYECGGNHLISDRAEDFQKLLSSKDFFVRTPTFVGEKVMTLTRESQAIAYSDLASKIIYSNKSEPNHA